MNKYDLHTHCAPYSTCAKQSIDELVNRAKEANIKYLAITNHDTIKDYSLFKEKCNDVGITYIPGVEISARVYDNIPLVPNRIRIHILGLNIIGSEQLEKELSSFKEINQKIKQARNDYISQKFNIIITKGMSKKDTRTKLVEIKAFENENKVREFLSTPEFLEKFKLEGLTPLKTIELIHKHGGKAILAHPFQGENHFDFSDEQVINIVKHVKYSGIDGIEIFHETSFNRKKIDFLLNLAKEFDLYVSIGSDRHFVEDRVQGKYFSFENELDERFENNFNIDNILI